MGRALEDTYSHDRIDQPTLVVDGYGATLRVHQGHLTITDGIGHHRRERRLTRSQRTVKRIVILAEAGTLTLDAIQWCTDTGISITKTRRDGTPELVSINRDHSDARLIRAQALAHTNGTALTIARHLINLKIIGQRDVLARIGADPTVLDGYANSIDSLDSTDELLDLESDAASDYFGQWRDHVKVSFVPRASHIPEPWKTFTARRSPLAGARSNRKARDPINAMLNYGYALGEAECVRACLALGLHPALGVLHTDKKDRDSLALDLLEVIRPSIELVILTMVFNRIFGPVDFIERPDGACRITETVTHPLTTAMPGWAALLAPTAELVAATLAGTAEGKIRARTPLTNARRSAGGPPGRRRRTQTLATAMAIQGPTERHCTTCGRILTGAARTTCQECRPGQRNTQFAEAAKLAKNDLWRERSQSPEARSKRAATIAANRQAEIAWHAQHGHPIVDKVAYEVGIVPSLEPIPITRIARTLGVSEAAASRIRKGTLIPHIRHWQTLRDLVVTSELRPESVTVEAATSAFSGAQG